METKVQHLWYKWEELEKDIQLLKQSKHRISQEREYSQALIQSFDSEIQKLETWKDSLLHTKIGVGSDEKKKNDKAPRKY